jgi:hypothetical protein
MRFLHRACYTTETAKKQWSLMLLLLALLAKALSV